MSEENTITINKNDLWKYATFVLAAVLLVGVLFAFNNNSNSGGTGGAVVGDSGGNLPPTGGKVEISADDDAVLGDKNAPVTIIEFSDYQCPFCQRFWSETLPLIKSEYIDTGKVKLVYRDFPLTQIHPAAMAAAQATECVREQGGDKAFWEMHDKIFENQQILSEASLRQWAGELGFNIDSCLTSNKFRNEVQKDLAEGSAAGVGGTPAFFVNGRLISGAQPFGAFKQAIDAELA
jgi:protein-disulfide isomerase